MTRVQEIKEFVETFVIGPKSHAKQVTYSDTYKCYWLAAQQAEIDRGASVLEKSLLNLLYSGVRKMFMADSIGGFV